MSERDAVFLYVVDSKEARSAGGWFPKTSIFNHLNEISRRRGSPRAAPRRHPNLAVSETVSENLG